MARQTTELTATTIKNAKPKEKDYKLFDGRGLYLLVTKSGGKRWRLKFQYDGKEKVIALGVYPDISLANARMLREQYRAEIANGINPAEERKAKKQKVKANIAKKANSLNSIKDKFFTHIEGELSSKYFSKLKRYYEYNVEKVIGSKPITDITRADILSIINTMQEREALEGAKKTLNLLERLFKYAVTNEYTPHNIIADFEKKLVIRHRAVRHHPTLTKPKDIKTLLIAIDEYSGEFITRCALQIAPYLALRPQELRSGEWCDIDLEKKEWRIPAHKMKMKKPHVVPLVPHVIGILKELYKHTGNNSYIFPNSIYKDRPMSENTLNTALRRMGFTKDEIVSHGFRSMFSTLAHENINEHGFHSDVIELCLAHTERNQSKASYNHAEHFKERVELMKWWSDYLENITSKASLE